MKIAFLPEPELQFGAGKHIDIRFGLMNYGPLDFASPLAPKQIKVGLIGTPQTIEGVESWLARCRDGIPAKQSKRPNLFPRFPGFRPGVAFQAELLIESRLQRSIAQREFDQLVSHSTANLIVDEAVQLFVAELRYLVQNTNADVLICAIPMSFLDLVESKTAEGIAQDGDAEEDEDSQRLDFHDLLKARAMGLMKPIQVILPMTYDESMRKRQKGRPSKIRELQDEATRAWNFHTALYYKANGTPWRLLRDPSQLTSCHVGISFYKTLDGSQLLTSIAQVFNERGDGVIVRGGQATISKDDKRPHLSEQAAYDLLYQALESYRQEHKTLPARAVLHKSSTYSAEELSGFREAIRRQRVDSIDLISMRSSDTRLFRTSDYPPLRGTFLTMDEQSHILYTRGSVDFFSTYPGMYVPHPLDFRCEYIEQTPRFIASEILALTKMNWNNTQFDRSEPITMRAADQVGDILKYVGEGDHVAPRYSYYM